MFSSFKTKALKTHNTNGNRHSAGQSTPPPPSLPPLTTTGPLAQARRPLPKDQRPPPQAPTNVLQLFERVPYLTEYLSVQEIQRLRRQEVVVVSGGTRYETTVSTEIPDFGRDRLNEKSLGEAADMTVDNLKKLNDYLTIANSMGPDQGNRFLRSLTQTGVAKVPERSRFQAWEMCLNAVTSKGIEVAISSETGVILPSGEFRYQSCEMHLRVSGECVYSLVQLTELIPRLTPRDRPAAWDQMYGLLDDSRLNLSKNQKLRMASHLTKATQFLWHTDHRLHNDDVIRRFDTITAKMKENNNGQPFSLKDFKHLMDAVRHISRDDKRNTRALELLQNTNLNLYLPQPYPSEQNLSEQSLRKQELRKQNVEKFLTEISLLIWSMGFSTTTGYITQPTPFPQPLLAQASAFGQTSYPQFAGNEGKSPLTEVNTDAEKYGAPPECELVRAIKCLFDSCASLSVMDQAKAVRTLFAWRPPQQDMAVFDAMIRAALISSPKGKDVSPQAVQTHRARMLGTVLSAAAAVFSEQDSAARKSNWFRPMDCVEGFFRFPAFINALVQKSCEMISVLPDHAEKLPLLAQLVDMLSWAQISTQSVSTPLRMIENQITAIPPDFPGRKDLYSDLSSRYFVH